MTRSGMTVFRAAVLTLSDKGSRGEREDTAGAAIRELLASAGGEVLRSEIIPDDRPRVEATLSAWADAADLDVIITTGGTGLSPRDVTPDATAAVIDYAVPGLA